MRVPAGGHYDSYRMQADLEDVARDPAAPGVDVVRRLPKRVVGSPVGRGRPSDDLASLRAFAAISVDAIARGSSR